MSDAADAAAVNQSNEAIELQQGIGKRGTSEAATAQHHRHQQHRSSGKSCLSLNPLPPPPHSAVKAADVSVHTGPPVPSHPIPPDPPDVELGDRRLVGPHLPRDASPLPLTAADTPLLQQRLQSLQLLHQQQQRKR
ncbi:hypothetical protein ACSSS7_007308 [Eimeria intestinalis]